MVSYPTDLTSFIPLTNESTNTQRYTVIVRITPTVPKAMEMSSPGKEVNSYI